MASEPLTEDEIMQTLQDRFADFAARGQDTWKKAKDTSRRHVKKCYRLVMGVSAHESKVLSDPTVRKRNVIRQFMKPLLTHDVRLFCLVASIVNNQDDVIDWRISLQQRIIDWWNQLENCPKSLKQLAFELHHKRGSENHIKGEKSSPTPSPGPSTRRPSNTSMAVIKSQLDSLVGLQKAKLLPPFSVEHLKPLPQLLFEDQPALYKADSCWKGEVPTDKIWQELWKIMINKVDPASATVYKEGKILEPGPERDDAVMLLVGGPFLHAGMAPLGKRFSIDAHVDSGSIFQVPPALITKLGSYIPEKITMVDANLTPTGYFSDIHANNNFHGFYQTLGPCKKIWLLYPPTDPNIQAFLSTEGKDGRLVNCADKLLGGYVVETDSSKVIYVPAGWLCAAITTVGGMAARKPVGLIGNPTKRGHDALESDEDE